MGPGRVTLVLAVCFVLGRWLLSSPPVSAEAEARRRMEAIEQRARERYTPPLVHDDNVLPQTDNPDDEWRLIREKPPRPGTPTEQMELERVLRERRVWADALKRNGGNVGKLLEEAIDGWVPMSDFDRLVALRDWFANVATSGPQALTADSNALKSAPLGTVLTELMLGRRAVLAGGNDGTFERLLTAAGFSESFGMGYGVGPFSSIVRIVRVKCATVHIWSLQDAVFNQQLGGTCVDFFAALPRIRRSPVELRARNTVSRLAIGDKGELRVMSHFENRLAGFVSETDSAAAGLPAALSSVYALCTGVSTSTPAVGDALKQQGFECGRK
jgi:hypothetical protein